MTELEKLLSDSLQELSLQYKADMRRLEARTSSLQEQVQGLQQQVASLAELIEQLE